MEKYKKTIIYKLCSDHVPEYYIGHTTLNLKTRFTLHKNYSINNNSKLYKFIKENGGFDKFKIEPLEIFSCDNMQEAKQKEREYILSSDTKLLLNKNIPLRNYKEWRKDKSIYNNYMKNYMRNYIYKRNKIKLT